MVFETDLVEVGSFLILLFRNFSIISHFDSDLVVLTGNNFNVFLPQSIDNISNLHFLSISKT